MKYSLSLLLTFAVGCNTFADLNESSPTVDMAFEPDGDLDTSVPWTISNWEGELVRPDAVCSGTVRELDYSTNHLSYLVDVDPRSIRVVQDGNGITTVRTFPLMDEGEFVISDSSVQIQSLVQTLSGIALTFEGSCDESILRSTLKFSNFEMLEPLPPSDVCTLASRSGFHQFDNRYTNQEGSPLVLWSSEAELFAEGFLSSLRAPKRISGIHGTSGTHAMVQIGTPPTSAIWIPGKSELADLPSAFSDVFHLDESIYITARPNQTQPQINLGLWRFDQTEVQEGLPIPKSEQLGEVHIEGAASEPIRFAAIDGVVAIVFVSGSATLDIHLIQPDIPALVGHASVELSTPLNSSNLVDFALVETPDDEVHGYLTIRSGVPLSSTFASWVHRITWTGFRANCMEPNR